MNDKGIEHNFALETYISALENNLTEVFPNLIKNLFNEVKNEMEKYTDVESVLLDTNLKYVRILQRALILNTEF